MLRLFVFFLLQILNLLKSALSNVEIIILYVHEVLTHFIEDVQYVQSVS